ncbi:hypothetical protein ACFWFV_14405 [Streptomyces diastaticus]|uniref:hypothetical protein n=1 Tax=Streptomyces diastaticus TaxID=1956 RepID=UPI0036533C86
MELRGEELSDRSGGEPGHHVPFAVGGGGTAVGAAGLNEVGTRPFERFDVGVAVKGALTVGVGVAAAVAELPQTRHPHCVSPGPSGRAYETTPGSFFLPCSASDLMSSQLFAGSSASASASASTPAKLLVGDQHAGRGDTSNAVPRSVHPAGLGEGVDEAVGGCRELHLFGPLEEVVGDLVDITNGLQDVGCATALERHLDLRVEVVPVEDLHVGLDLRAGMSKRSAMSRQ